MVYDNNILRFNYEGYEELMPMIGQIFQVGIDKGRCIAIDGDYAFMDTADKGE